jgi:hypothetical protein
MPGVPPGVRRGEGDLGARSSGWGGLASIPSDEA